VLFATVRRDLGLPARTAVYAVAFNALIVLVKFVLGPVGLYDVNRYRSMETFIPLSDPFGAAFAGAFIFLLYAGVLTIIYRILLRLVRGPRAANPQRVRRFVMWTLIAALVLAGSAGVIAVLAATILSSASLYLSYVFSSGVSLLVALALAGATSLAVMTFSSAADRDRLVEDASTLVTVFWIALAFVALYHVLWVIYILVLTSIWPLKVVVPK
jgi:hypothetical protein